MLAKHILLINPLEIWSRKIHVSSLWLQLKSHYQQYGKHTDQWVWELPLTHIDEFTFDGLVDVVCGSKPDIIGFSMQMWNSKLNHALAAAIRTHLPHALIIAGGPYTQHKHNMSWFKHHPSFDVICSQEGYGEDFMTTLLDKIVEGNVCWNDIPNAIYPSTSSRSMWVKSPLTTNKREFLYPTSMFTGSLEYLETLKFIAKAEGKRLALNYETTRGCPYACSFCDWPGGLRTRIVRKSDETMKLELQHIEQIGLNEINLCDANFGALNKRDIAIAERFVEISQRGELDSVSMYGKAKHSIEIVEKIDTMFLDAGLYGQDDIYIITINAVSDDILKAIDRTNQPFAKFIPVAQRIREKYGKKIKLEMIMGLPLATLDTFYAEFDAFDMIEGWATERHPWALLMESPGAIPEYVDTYGIKTITVGYYSGDDITNQIYTPQRRDSSLMFDYQYHDTYEIVIETNTYTTNDWQQMFIVDHFARTMELSEFVTKFRKQLQNETGITTGQFYCRLWEQFQQTSAFVDVLDDIKMQVQEITKGNRRRYEWFTSVLIPSTFIKLETYFNLMVMLRPVAFYEMIKATFAQTENQHLIPVIDDICLTVPQYSSLLETVNAASMVFQRKVL